jgi:undecaprenyl-diphosphatase
MGGVGMNVSLIEAVLYGAASGLTEFMPVSSVAHQKLLLNLFGIEETVALMDLFVHIGIVFAILVASGGMLQKSAKEYRILKKSARRRKREPNVQLALDYSFIKMAFLPLIIGYVFYLKTAQWSDKPPILSLLLVLNGLFLYLPMLMARGNKNSRSMSALDGVLFGIGGALSVMPGISRIGVSSSMAIMRGADPREAYKWSLYLSIPALLILVGFDVFGLFRVGLKGVEFLDVLMSLLSGCTAYFCASFAISLMKTLAADKGIAGFAYYSWGMALFTFVLYLY